MFIVDDGIRLNVQLDRPDNGAEHFPLVIIIHGFTGHMEERHITAVSRELNAMGFGTLRADMYGHGKSDGEFKNHTLYKWLTNAMTLVDYAAGLEYVDKLFLCGHSQGGLTVMLTAAMERERISAVIPMSPACMIPECARKGHLLGMNFDPNSIPNEISTWDGLTLKGNYIRVAQTIHVEDAIEKYKGPVFIVHGDKDEAVPVQYSIDVVKGYANGELVLIPGDDHCYNYHLDEVIEAVRKFMQQFVD